MRPESRDPTTRTELEKTATFGAPTIRFRVAYLGLN